MKRIAMIQMFAWVGLALAAPQVGAEDDKDGNATPTPVSTPGSPTPSPTLMIRQTTILIAALSFWTACLLPLPSALHADDDATTSTMRRTRLVGYFPPINGVPVHNHIERVCLLAPDFGRADAPIANLVFIGRPGRTVLVAAFEDGEVVWHRNWRAPFPGWPPERLPDHTPLMGPYYRARVDPTLVDDLVRLFLAECPSLAQTLRAALQSRDAAACIPPAHRLKSSAEALGLGELARLCRTIEELGHSGEIPPRLADEFAATFERAGDAMGSLLR